MVNQVVRALVGVALVLGALGLVAPAYGVDGVIEINQAKALAGGVTLSDTPGFPVTITESGSYRLTSDLVVEETNLDCLYLLAGNVTIDLNGFSLRGPSSGSGSGVAAGLPNVRIMNGTVALFGGRGIETVEYAYIEGVRAVGNKSWGILANGFGSVVIDSVALYNATDGIKVGDHAVVSGCTATENGEDGIQTGHGAVVRGNTATANGETGINTLSGSTVVDNTVRLNSTWGLSLSTDTGYSGNVSNGNASGAVTQGIVMGTNLCNASISCP